ncbi:hypothetical protein D3C86_1496830 [compost metagenome]
MNHFRVVEQVPWRNEDRRHCRDHTACAPADFARGDVGEIEGRGNEVGNDVNADGRGDKGECAEQHGHTVVDARHGGDGVVKHLTEHRQGPGNNHHGHQGERQKIYRQAPEVAATHVFHTPAVTTEITEIQGRT